MIRDGSWMGAAGRGGGALLSSPCRWLVAPLLGLPLGMGRVCLSRVLWWGV